MSLTRRLSRVELLHYVRNFFSYSAASGMYRELEMINEEDVKMAKPTEPRIVLDSGSRRIGTTLSSRTFFVYVTPTGAELPLGQCPTLKREYSQSHGRFGTPDYMQSAAYILRGEARLKMVCLASTFGKPRRIIHMFVDIGPDLEVIEFQGAAECGKFSGRGRIDMKASTILENKTPIEVTPEILKEHFGYRILQAGTAAAAAKKGIRSLIF